MADMDTLVIRDRPDEYISVTLGPEGHTVPRFELLRMIAKAVRSIELEKQGFNDGNLQDVDLTI
jgi:hypothetical protein